jgi:hypothetical protein
MFGFGEDKGNPWLIKGNIDTQVNVNYNSAAIKEYADILNKTLNWEHDLDKGQVKNHPYYNVLSLVENELAFNKELYGKKDLGIINGQTDVSGYINSKLQEINAKYDAELAALEGKPAEAPKSIDQKIQDAWNNIKGAPVDPNYREIVTEQIGKFEGENWKKLESYIKKRLPNVPVYRVKTVLKGTNGVQAWGMFKDGAIYIYTNAEVGTGYHEIFHAVYQIFADANERENVKAEFKARPGSFTDRVSGQDIKHSEATDREVEEQLAEEFRDYVLYGKVPMKPIDNRPFIIRIF